MNFRASGPALAAECNDEAFANLNSQTTRITAETVAEGTVVARARRRDAVAPSDFCRVVGNINGNINFEVWLPSAETWDRKLNVHGNGGLAGTIGHANLAEALELDFATASTDTGHTNGNGPRPLVNGTVSEELLTDWAHRAHYLTTLAARDVIDTYYGSEPRYSYFTGCSGGGGHGLHMAQKYPTLFDGIIEDPRLCTFDPASMVCPAGVDNASCLTSGQADSVGKIYEGLRDPATGEQIWPGYEPGSEDGWGGHIGEPFSIPLSYFKYMVFENPDWDWHEFIGNDEFYQAVREGHEKISPLISAIDADLSEFKANGGKAETDDFLRLFMVPGMKHCNGGAGFHDFDALAALEAWVENGDVPESIEAYSPAKEMSRPLCPYPGLPSLSQPELDPSRAENFVCTLPDG